MDDRFNELGGADGESVLNWLDEIAEAEGLSREAAIQYLISSYWRLEEVVDLLEAGEGRSASVVDAGPTDDLPAPTEIDGLHERFDTLLDELRYRDEPPGERLELLPGIVELGERLERLEETLEADAFDSQGFEDLADQAAAYQSRLASLEADMYGVGDRVDDLAESAVTEERLDAVVDQTRVFQDSISRQQDSLRDRVRTEFDHIRTILDHLLDATASNERRTDRLAVELRQELRAHVADRETLATITRTANRQGISEATCEHCGTDVDLSMLQSPVCPNCAQDFTDLETTRRLFGLFRSHLLTVSDASSRPHRE